MHVFGGAYNLPPPWMRHTGSPRPQGQCNVRAEAHTCEGCIALPDVLTESSRIPAAFGQQPLQDGWKRLHGRQKRSLPLVAADLEVPFLVPLYHLALEIPGFAMWACGSLIVQGYVS